jgi:hypothetical protein
MDRRHMNNDELQRQLELIGTAAGALTPDAVVDAASKKNHPLHDEFNWDDTEAAHNWRKQQARQLIARVDIVLAKTTSRGVVNVTCRAFASVVSEDGEKQYMNVLDVSADPELSSQVLTNLRREIGTLKRKFSAYDGIFAQVLTEVLAEEG